MITTEDVHDHETNVVTIDDDIPVLRSRIWARKGAEMRYRPTKNEPVQRFFSMKYNKLKNALTKVSTHFSKKLQKLNDIVKMKKIKVKGFFKRN